MFKQLKALFGKGQDRGFTLIELLIVVLIVGILAAVAVPLYLGYIKDAKMTEGKSVAGALWTSAQANSLASCGGAGVNVSTSYARAGLDTSGKTADGRWQAGTTSSLIVDCTTGAYTPAGDKFTITGLASDLAPLVVKLNFNSALTPPARLQCASDGVTFVNC